jgi:hypothetical protein
VYLGDHDGLHEGSIDFETGWDMRRFIELLDGFVFFWPGTESTAVQAATAHLMRYVKLGLEYAVLRVPLPDLVDRNGLPRLSSCNSGFPRNNPTTGRQSRGAKTFVTVHGFKRTGKIVEVVFAGAARLPETAQQATSYAGPWAPLFGPELAA